MRSRMCYVTNQRVNEYELGGGVRVFNCFSNDTLKNNFMIYG